MHKNGKKSNMTGVFDAVGQFKDASQDIVNVFADFYAELYKSRRLASEGNRQRFDRTGLPDITEGEVCKQLQKMSKGRAADRAGL
eukprot:8875726-Karenia_brevis.AAC.1